MKVVLRYLLQLIASLGLAVGVNAAEPAVLVVSSERGAAYQEAAEAAAGEIVRVGDPRREVQQLALAELANYRGSAPRLYITLGSEACAALARSATTAPVLCTLLPRLGFERIVRESGRRTGPAFSALYLNQPLGRQLDLVRVALPQARRVGVLWGPDSQFNEAPLESAALARGLQVVGATIKPDELVFNGLKTILEQADLLLAIADPHIYNSNSIQNILLASFRAQVPMLAFSPAYVRAGALMAVYSTPAQIGQQAGALARAALQGQALGAPQHPQQFEVSVNEHVARSLGLKLDAASLTERLRRLERGS